MEQAMIDARPTQDEQQRYDRLYFFRKGWTRNLQKENPNRLQSDYERAERRAIRANSAIANLMDQHDQRIAAIKFNALYSAVLDLQYKNPSAAFRDHEISKHPILQSIVPQGSFRPQEILEGLSELASCRVIRKLNDNQYAFE
jgi:hypothetical protein